MKKKRFKDPGSAITHLIGCVLSIFASIPLIIRASNSSSSLYTACAVVFSLSMILLYAASTIYHTFDISEKVNKILKKMDHIMIFILIAGTYTPVCLIAIGQKTGTNLLIFVCIIALLGILLKSFWINCPKWVSSVIYIGLGWACIPAASHLYNALSSAAFGWLLAGGIIYTIGGIIYAFKLPVFNSKHKNFGSHEIFHLFVMAGSFCLYIFIYQYVMQMPLPSS